MKKTTALIMSIVFFLIAFFSFSSCSKKDEVDLSDIEEMYIGSDMPTILFCDTQKLIMSGTFGFIVFDFEIDTVKTRVTHEEIKAQGITYANMFSSKDGKSVYMYNETFDSSKPLFIKKFDVKTKKFSTVKDIEDERFEAETLDVIEGGKYSSFVDLSYLSGNEIVKTQDGVYVYLRAETNWSMKTLQIVKYNEETGLSEIINVF